MRQWILLIGLLVSLSALAQREPPDAPPALPDDGGAPRVYYAHSYEEGGWDRAGIGELLSLHVRNFKSLLEKTNDTCNGLVLFINGMPIKGLQPQSCDRGNGHVRYRLLRTEQSDEAWRALLGSPVDFTRPVSISIGVDDQFSIPSSVTRFQFVVIPRGKLYSYLGVMLVGGWVFVWLCRSRGLIREGREALPVEKQPYSLSLFQMAFWFFIVVAAYVFIWMINDELDTITDSVLALLGVGSATALGAALIDKNKAPPQESESSGTPRAAARPRESRGFIMDLLLDGATLSLHRFQLFAWTLILGGIFCSSVYKSLEMPEFSATMVGLMGISSGTYLGFKLPEGRKKEGAPLAGTPGAGGDEAAPGAGS